MSDTELYSALATASSPLVNKKNSTPALVRVRRTSKDSLLSFDGLDSRETQSDCEVLEDSKLKKRRSSRFLTLSNSLRRLSAGRKSKRKNRVPVLATGLGQIAFGIGAGFGLDAENNEAMMRTLHNNFEQSLNDRYFNSPGELGEIDCINSNAEDTQSVVSCQQESGNNQRHSIHSTHSEHSSDLVTDLNSDDSSDKQADRLSGHSQSEALDRFSSDLTQKQNGATVSPNNVCVSSSEDSLDELDARPNTLPVKAHRPVRRLHKSYKIAVKNRPIHAPGVEPVPKTSPVAEEDLDEADESANVGPSPFKRNMYKSYRVAMTKLKDEDSTTVKAPWVAADKERARRAEMASKYLRHEKVLTPEEIVVIPPSPKCKSKSSSLPLRSSLNGEFVSITDLRRMKTDGNIRLSDRLDDQVDGLSLTSNIRKSRPCSSPDMETVPICEALTPPSSRRRPPVMHRYDSVALRLPYNDILSESPSSSIAGSQDEFCPSNRQSSTDTDSDSNSETSHSSADKADSKSNSLLSIEEEEMKEDLAPLKQAIPRSLKQRKKGRDSVRRLRDKRVDLISEQESELNQLKRSRSWNTYTNHKESDQKSHSSKSVKGVS